MRKKLYFERVETGEWDWYITELDWEMLDIYNIEGVSLLFDKCCEEKVVSAHMEYSSDPFPGSNELVLLSLEPGNHAIYWLSEYNGEKMNHRLDIVFSDGNYKPCIPEKLYVGFYGE